MLAVGYWIDGSDQTNRISISARVFRSDLTLGYHRLFKVDARVTRRWSDGWGGWLRPGVASVRASGGVSRPSTAAHQSLSFLELRWSVSIRFAPAGSERWGEHVYSNLNRWRAATKPGNGEAAQPVLVDDEGGLWWSFGSKDVRQGFLDIPSIFSTDQLLWSVVENLNLLAT
jgi:hypothetical protein